MKSTLSDTATGHMCGQCVGQIQNAKNQPRGSCGSVLRRDFDWSAISGRITEFAIMSLNGLVVGFFPVFLNCAFICLTTISGALVQRFEKPSQTPRRQVHLRDHGRLFRLKMFVHRLFYMKGEKVENRRSSLRTSHLLDYLSRMAWVVCLRLSSFSCSSEAVVSRN